MEGPGGHWDGRDKICTGFLHTGNRQAQVSSLYGDGGKQQQTMALLDCLHLLYVDSCKQAPFAKLGVES